MNTESGDKYLRKTKDTFGFCPIYRHLTDEKGKLIYLPVLFFFSSPSRTPAQVVPQIRIELEPDDNDDYWRSKGTETTL